jgi:hypothetical protein
VKPPVPHGRRWCGGGGNFVKNNKSGVKPEQHRDSVEMECASPVESERTWPGVYVFDEALGRFRLERAQRERE